MVQSLREGLKRGASLGLEELVGQLLLLFVEIGQVGLRLFRYAVDKPVLPEAEGDRHVAGLEAEGRPALLAAGGAGDRAVARNRLARVRLLAGRAGFHLELCASVDAFMR